MQIGILQTGSVPDELAETHGQYEAMFERLLQRADPAFTVSLWNINEEGNIPASPLDADGWLITGSKHGVYDPLPWIEPLKAFLREVHDAGAPMAGICFGHQIMAEALGGRAVKSDRGWGVGVNSYRITDAAPWMEDAPDSIAVHALHQDQVVTLPPGARVLAESPFCPFAALAYGETAFSIQPHPEFDAGFTRDIITARRGSVIPEAAVDDALDGLGQSVDSDLAGRWITRFFRHAAAQRKAA